MEFKCRITTEQLNELNEDQKTKLREWWKPEIGDCYCEVYKTSVFETEISKYLDFVDQCDGYNECECAFDDGKNPAKTPDNYSLPLLDIGQMIEFLQENGVEFIYDFNEFFCKIFKGKMVESTSDELDINKPNFCDQLFETVKAVL